MIHALPWRSSPRPITIRAAADIYSSSDAFHKHEGWRCFKEQAIKRATAGKDTYSYTSHSGSSFSIDDELYSIPDPYGGSVI